MFTFLATRRRRAVTYLVAVAFATVSLASVSLAANPFVDIDGNPYAPDINATHNAGITAGCTDATRYCPSDPVKRDLAAALLARTAGLSSSTTKRFPVANARSPLQTYCSLASTSPRSFEAGPCSATAIDVDTASVGSDTSVAIGADGMPIVSYFDIKNGDLKVARCGNPACSGNTNFVTIDSVGTVGRNSSIAVGADGLPVISYYDVTNGNLKAAHCTNVACSSNTTVSTLDSAGNVGQFTSLAIGADGVPLVAYHDATNGDLKVARCTGVACTAVTTMPLDASGVVGQYPSLAIGADNVAAITYFDATNNRLKFTRCSDPLCRGGASTVTLAPNSVAGQYSSIAIGVDGLPVVAYYDRGAGDLKVARCGNTVCSANVTYAAVDTQGDAGKYAAIAIGTDGKPVIASYRSDGANLRLAKCLNSACSTSTLRSLDSNGDVGSYASIAMGVDGVPVVAYHDAGGGYLKVARPPAV